MRTHNILAATVLAAALAAPTFAAKNKALNGSFERPSALSNAKGLKDKGFEVPAANDAKAWAQHWYINAGTQPALVEIRTDGAAKGRRYLHARNKTKHDVHVHMRTIKTPVIPYFSFQARGEEIEIDGEKIKPVAKLAVYEYGIRKDTGKVGFLRTRVIKTFNLDKEWKTYEGDISPSGDNVQNVSYVLALDGEADVDDVFLGDAPAAPSAAKPEAKTDAKQKDKEIASIGKRPVIVQERQIATVVNTRRPIVIDGVLGEDEWQDATVLNGMTDRNGKYLADTPTRVYLTYDDKYLYIGFHSEIPEEVKNSQDELALHGYVRKMAVTRDEPFVIQKDDRYLFKFIPAVSPPREYYFQVNGLDTIYDVYRSDVGYGAHIGWDSRLETKSQIDTSGWTMEARLPLADLAVDKIQDGDEWKMMFQRIWKLLKDETDSWPSTASGSWTQFGRVVFRRDDGVTLRTREFAEPSADRARVAASARNRSGKAQHLVFSLKSNGQTLARETREIPANGVADVVLEKDLKRTKVSSLTYEVQTQDGQTIASTTVPFEKERRAAVHLRMYPSSDLLTMGWDLARVGKEASQLEGVFELTNAGAGETAFKDTVSPLPALQGEAEFSSKGIPDGEYRAHLTIRAGDEEIVSRTIDYHKRPLPEWYGNQIGISDKVPPPYTPIKVEGDAVSVWGRTYNFENSLVPNSILNQGYEILAGPMNFLLATGDGKRIDSAKSKCAVEWKTKSDAMVAFVRKQDIGDISITIDSRIEYDGMQWMDITIAPKGASAAVRELTLTIPLKKQYATLLNNHEHSMNSLGRLPKEGYASSMGMRWVGWEEGGLQVFAETSESWISADKLKEYLVTPRANSVDMELRIIGKPTTLKAPMTVAFGYTVTPVKKSPPARDILTGGMATYPNPEWLQPRIDYHTAAYKHHMGLVSVNIWHPGWWHNPFRDKSKKLRFDSFYPYPKEDIRKNFGLVKNMNGVPIRQAPYCQTTLAWLGSPEFRQFGYEWVDVRDEILDVVYNENPSPSRVYVCNTARSYQDFYLAGLKELLDKTRVKDLYFDVSRARICDNVRHGCGYRVGGGKVHGTEAFLGAREISKRIYTLIKENDPEGMVFRHMSGQAAMPVYAFADAMIDGEHMTGMLDRKDNRGYEHILPLDKFAAEFAGQNNLGPYTIFLAQFMRSKSIRYEEWEDLGYQHAEYILGLLFLHNTQLWFGAYIPDEPTCKLYAAFDLNGCDSTWNFTGYWKQEGVALPDDLKATFYVAPDGKKALMLVMNFAWDDRTLDLPLAPKKIGMDAELTSAKMLYAEGEVELANETLEDVTVPAKNFRLFLLE